MAATWGEMFPPKVFFTEKDISDQLGINALGPFLFQHYLSSSGHRASPAPDGIQWDDINLKSATGFRGHALKYGQSKAMNVMHAHELARKYTLKASSPSFCTLER
jgi:retinol dehydrogenase-12